MCTDATLSIEAGLPDLYWQLGISTPTQLGSVFVLKLGKVDLCMRTQRQGVFNSQFGGRGVEA